jgi:hypothetical protein
MSFPYSCMHAHMNARKIFPNRPRATCQSRIRAGWRLSSLHPGLGDRRLVSVMAMLRQREARTVLPFFPLEQCHWCKLTSQASASAAFF